MKNNHSRKGITLIELMVGVLIVALIATIGLIAVKNVRAKSRDTKRIYDIQQYAKALRMYAQDHGMQFPDMTYNGYLGRGGAIDSELKDYLPALPKDPLDKGESGLNAYYYFYLGNNNCSGRIYPTVHVQNVETAKAEYNINLCQETGIENSNLADYLIIIN